MGGTTIEMSKEVRKRQRRGIFFGKASCNRYRNNEQSIWGVLQTLFYFYFIRVLKDQLFGGRGVPNTRLQGYLLWGGGSCWVFIFLFIILVTWEWCLRSFCLFCFL